MPLPIPSFTPASQFLASEASAYYDEAAGAKDLQTSRANSVRRENDVPCLRQGESLKGMNLLHITIANTDPPQVVAVPLKDTVDSLASIIGYFKPEVLDEVNELLKPYHFKLVRDEGTDKL
jgi:hypothetical protein